MVLGIRMTHTAHRGSVLPPIAASQMRGGTRLIVARTSWKDLVVLFFIFMFLTLFVGMLATGVVSKGRELQAYLGIATMAGGLLELGRRYLRQRRIQSAAIVVRPWPLRLGENVTATFSSRLRGSSVVAKLLCIEETRHSMGKYETVKHASRFELDIDTSDDEWAFFIPVSGLPSLTVRSNKVQWIVRATISTEGQEIQADFELLVVPEVLP